MTDEITINVKAGAGGDGAINFRREKFVPKGGPDGGDGGKGGDIFLRTVQDITVLSKYKHKPKFAAENGANGARAKMHGKSGKAVIIDVPVGSFVTNTYTRETYDLTELGDIVLVAAGGKGGLGNVHFKNSQNTTPKINTSGTQGQQYDLHIELKIICDIGIIGYPNAGKTTFLNTVTKAKGKVGNYEFTTLNPNLGVYHNYVLADIPGLIEGAATGKGLGHSFLKHIGRARMLIHMIDMDRHGDNILGAYKSIRKEMEEYSKELMKKPEIIFLTKKDLVEDAVAKESMEELASTQKKLYIISVYNQESIKIAMDEVIKELKKYF